jgi:hypothetical protein
MMHSAGIITIDNSKQFNDAEEFTTEIKEESLKMADSSMTTEKSMSRSDEMFDKSIIEQIVGEVIESKKKSSQSFFIYIHYGPYSNLTRKIYFSIEPMKASGEVVWSFKPKALKGIFQAFLELEKRSIFKTNPSFIDCASIVESLDAYQPRSKSNSSGNSARQSDGYNVATMGGFVEVSDPSDSSMAEACGKIKKFVACMRGAVRQKTKFVQLYKVFLEKERKPNLASTLNEMNNILVALEYGSMVTEPINYLSKWLIDYDVK